MKISLSAVQLKANFDRYDADHSGFITANELKAIYSSAGGQLNDDTIKRISDQYDKNKDGKISYSEFHEFMTGVPDTSNATGVTIHSKSSHQVQGQAPGGH